MSTTCPCCERKAPLLDCGLCNHCAAAEPLVQVFSPGFNGLLAEADDAPVVPGP